MEPERQIEKVLRTFAKKRREQAGSPLELHPVNRRLLQDEVTRQTSKPRERPFFLNWLAVIRPRLSFILCVVALSAVGLWFVLPLFTTAKSRSIRVAQENRSRMEELAGEPRQPATSPARASAESDSALKKERMDQSGLDKESENKRPSEMSDFDRARNVDQRQIPPATVAPTPVASPINAEKLAASFSNSDFAPETRLSQNERARSAAAMTNTIALADENGPALARTSRVPEKPALGSEALANGPAGRAGGGFREGAAGSIRFQRIQNQPVSVAAPVPVQTKSADAFGGLSTVTDAVSNGTLLDSFALEQNGRELQVIDHDGSVYKGYLQFGESPAPGSPALPAKEKAETLSANRSLTQMDRPADSVALESLAHGWSFRVSGTNLSLKQNIVFTGNLLVATNESVFGSSTTATVGGAGAIEAQTGSLQLLFRNSRINGTVLIENTGKLEIIATPTVK